MRRRSRCDLGAVSTSAIGRMSFECAFKSSSNCSYFSACYVGHGPTCHSLASLMIRGAAALEAIERSTFRIFNRLLSWDTRMQAMRPVARTTQRCGFTLIELLVVIAIIATLAALLLSAISAARETSRRNQCMSNMRNVSLGMQTYATNNKNALPYLISDPAKLQIWSSV